MSIVNGQTITASDFVSASSGASDNGKVAKLDTSGKVPRGFVYSALRNAGIASKNVSDANGATQAIAHGLGVTPIRVRIKALYSAGASSGKSVDSDGVWITGGTYACVFLYMIEGGSTATDDYGETSTVYVVKLADSQISGGAPSAYQTATVTVDATNITLTWAKTGSPNNISFSFLWEAEGYS